MFQFARNLIAGNTVVAPPMDNEPYIATAPIAEGTLVTPPTNGQVSVANDVDNVFGVAVNTANEGDVLRIAYVIPGMIFKVETSELIPAGTEAGINSTGDGLTVGANSAGVLVLRCVEDQNMPGRFWAWVVFKRTALMG